MFKNIKMTLQMLAAGATLVSGMSAANATTIDFEGYAPPGGAASVTPEAPYAEDGFLITPTNHSSAVFDAAYETMFESGSDWLGFADTNPVTLTRTSGSGVFDLISLVAGRAVSGFFHPGIDLTFNGYQLDGGMLTMTFFAYVAQDYIFTNWVNLTSLEIINGGPTTAGLDNIVLSERDIIQVPEPASLGLLGLGLISIGLKRRKRV